MPIWFGGFQGISKPPSIVGWEFSFNIEVKKSGNSSRNVSVSTAFFFEYDSLYIRAKEALYILTISPSDDF